jgi:putative zinc finger/helix-turn-helix YgiT family protein
LNHREKCPTCGGGRLFLDRGHHHFIESGLDNVHLVNVDIWRCRDCGEEIVSIPRSTELMKTIGESILLKPTSLSGAEIRFLRKNLTLKINEFAQLLGVDRVTVSRWENEHEKPSRSTDRLVRLTYAVEAKVSETVMESLRKILRREGIDSQMDYFVSLPLAS